MENIIRTIVDMDKRARRRTEEAEMRSEQVDSNLSMQLQAIRDEQQSSTQQLIENQRISCEADTAEKIRLADIEAEGLLESLEKHYSENAVKWANELAARALTD